MIQCAHHAFDDIVYIGEVALMHAEVENVDRFAFEDIFGEHEKRHVRPAPRPINRKKTETSGGQREQMAVGVGHQFIGLF